MTDPVGTVPAIQLQTSNSSSGGVTLTQIDNLLATEQDQLSFISDNAAASIPQYILNSDDANGNYIPWSTSHPSINNKKYIKL